MRKGPSGPFVLPIALAFEALSVYELLELFFFFALSIKPGVSALTRLGTIPWQLDDFVVLEFVVHSSVGDREGNGTAG